MTDDDLANPPELDADLLTRWIGISSLIANADEMLAREGGAWAGLALVATDAATEALLGLLVVDGPEPPGSDARFEDVYQSAIKALRAIGRDLPAGLGPRLVDAHRARNLALHRGHEPAPRAVGRAIKATRDLRDVAIAGSTLLAPFAAVGPVRAIAGFVAIDAVCNPLLEADRFLREGRLEEAANQAAIAFDLALRRVDPPLRQREGPRSRMAFGRPGELVKAPSGMTRRPDEIGPLDDRLALVETWVLALGVGLPPAKMARLRRFLGKPRYYAERNDVQRDLSIVLTRDIVERAILEVADVIFRLWLGDGLRPETKHP
jgi:hypothetical protein